MFKLSTQTKIFTIFIIITLAVFSLFISCSKDDPIKPPPDDNNDPTVIDQSTVAVTTAGADLQLKNGMTLSIPPNAVNGTVNVELAQLAGDTNFTADFQTVLNIKTDGTISSASLVIPLATGQDTALVGAAYFDNTNEKITLLNGAFNATNDTFMVSLTDYSVSLSSDDISKGQYVVTTGVSYTPSHTEVVKELPYYQQDGGNCWAACMLIFMKAHKENIAYDEIYEILKTTGVGKDDGYGWYSMGSMKNTCELITGLKAEKNTWIRYKSFENYVKKCIDENKPVMVNLIKHQGVICGYEIVSPGQFNYIFHDPANWLTQTPYRKMTREQMLSEYWNQGALTDLFNYFVTINFTTAMLSSPNLETIHLQDATAGGTINSFEEGLAFVKGALVVDYLTWDHTKKSGYKYGSGSDLPGDLSSINLKKVPVWNMSRSTTADVEIKTTLYKYVNETFVYPGLIEKSEYQSITPVNDYLYNVEFQVDEFADNLAATDTLFAIEVRLFNDANIQVDDFFAAFEFHPLRITSLDPNSAEIMDQISINGMGFGELDVSSGVKFGDVEADIISWSNDEIIVDVPEGATSSDITVFVGDAVSNGMPFTLEGEEAGLLDTLHLTNKISITVYGEHYSGPNVTSGIFNMLFQKDQIVWNDTTFTINISENNDFWSVTGHVSKDGRTLWKIDASLKDSSDFLTSIEHYSLKNIPLASWYFPHDKVIYEVFFDGSTADNYVDHLANSIYRSDGSVYYEYLYTDWNSATATPKIRIDFKRD